MPLSDRSVVLGMDLPGGIPFRCLEVVQTPADGGTGTVMGSWKMRTRIATLGLPGAIIAMAVLRLAPEPVPTVIQYSVGKPVWPSGLDAAPPEVREFLKRVLDHVPEGGKGVTGYQFHHWKAEAKPTDEAIGLKVAPGVDPKNTIERVMDVNSYRGHIAYVEECQSRNDPAYELPEKVRFFQKVRVPGIARVQQELVLVDAGMIKGYRLAYWYLLKRETESLDPNAGARSEFNVGAWLVAPGVVGYALSSWPQRGDVNALQWASLTSGADVLAKKVVETNIDGLATWAKTNRNRPR